VFVGEIVRIEAKTKLFPSDIAEPAIVLFSSFVFCFQCEINSSYPTNPILNN
jgi:hypothetical protein